MREDRRRSPVTETQPPHPTVGTLQAVPQLSGIDVLRSGPFQLFVVSAVATTAGLCLFERPLMSKAIAFGTLQVAFGRIIGGYGAGRVLSLTGPKFTFILAAACMTLGLLVMASLRPKHSFTSRHPRATFRDGVKFVI